jgi:hypothetical protein
LFLLTYGVASSAVKYFMKREVGDEGAEVENHQYAFQKALKESGK